MKTFKQVISEAEDPHLKKTHFDDGKSRFYYGDTGYFAIGAKVKTPETYKGITEGTVESIHPSHAGQDHPYNYRISHTLPKGHPEATDENGEPEYKKTQLVRGEELTRRNPKEDWDGK